MTPEAHAQQENIYAEPGPAVLHYRNELATFRLSFIIQLRRQHGLERHAGESVGAFYHRLIRDGYEKEFWHAVKEAQKHPPRTVEEHVRDSRLSAEERTRREDELVRHPAKVAALNKIAHTLATTHDVDELISAFQEAVLLTGGPARFGEFEEWA